MESPWPSKRLTNEFRNKQLLQPPIITYANATGIP